MSWVQVKKRFAEIEAYLGKDKEGIKRLKLLKDEVNVLRTDLAAAREEAQLAQTIKDAARERADVAEAAAAEFGIQVKSLGLKLQSMSQHVASLTQEVNKLSGADNEAPVEYADERGTTTAEIRKVIKAVRKKRPKCPVPVRISSDLITATEFYEREDIATGWSHESLWMLGATAAVLTFFLGQVVIFSSEGVSDVFDPRDAAGKQRYPPKWALKAVDPALREAGILTAAEMMCNRDGLHGDML